eukprot:757656-Hanusia_phi.AAC.3
MERAGGRTTTAEARRRHMGRQVSDGSRQRKTLVRAGHATGCGNVMRNTIHGPHQREAEGVGRHDTGLCSWCSSQEPGRMSNWNAKSSAGRYRQHTTALHEYYRKSSSRPGIRQDKPCSTSWTNL